MVMHHRQFRGLEIGLFYFILNALFLINELIKSNAPRPSI